MKDFKTIPVEEQLAHIRRGSVEIIREEELVEKLKRAQKTGKPLKPASIPLHPIFMSATLF